MEQLKRLLRVCAVASVVAALSAVSWSAWTALAIVVREWLSSDSAADWVSAAATLLAVLAALGISLSENRRARKAEYRARRLIEQDTLKAAQVGIARLSATVGALDHTCRSGDLEGFSIKMYKENVALSVAQLNALPLHYLPARSLMSPVTNIAICGGTVTTMLDLLDHYDADAGSIPAQAFADIRQRIEDSEDLLVRAAFEAGMNW